MVRSESKRLRSLRRRREDYTSPYPPSYTHPRHPSLQELLDAGLKPVHARLIVSNLDSASNTGKSLPSHFPHMSHVAFFPI